jgi:DNA-binding winged helix-turn-helix (wHTH) protein/TolB-like protein
MPRVRFGLFEFDPVTGELLRAGAPVRLQHQPARVLGLLVERAGEIVTRDDIQRHVWGDETFVDFERGLNFCIAQIRSALGDSADSPRYIETLPKRGYRFIAPVQSTESATATAPRAPAPATLSRLQIVGLVLLLLVVGVAFWNVQTWSRSWSRDLIRGPAVPIAVVPFDNQTGSSEYDRLAQGLADATVAQLAQHRRRPRLSVVGNAAILRKPRDQRDLKAIGDELDVDYIVLGQVQKDGAQVRVVAHLIRVSDQRHLWANRFDRPALTLATQGEIAEAIATSVASRLREPQPTS